MARWDLKWRKSSYSGGGGTSDCVELADLGRGVGVRDSKDPSGGHLAVTREGLAVLLSRANSGDLDL